MKENQQIIYGMNRRSQFQQEEKSRTFYACLKFHDIAAFITIIV